MDERQGTPFAAAWLVATVAAAAEAGAARMTLFELSGPRGLFDPRTDDRFPLFSVVAALGEADGLARCVVDGAGELAVLALHRPGAVRLLLANRSSSRVRVAVGHQPEIAVEPQSVASVDLDMQGAA